MQLTRAIVIPAFLLACLMIYFFGGGETAQSLRVGGRASAGAASRVSRSVDSVVLPGWAADQPEPGFAEVAEDENASAENPLPQAVGEILLVLDDLAGQGLSHDELLNSESYQLLMAKLQSDPAARQAVLARIMKTSGTPLGKTLVLAVATSGAGVGMGTLKSSAEWLLKHGNSEQRADALQLLGSTPSYTPQTRTALLEALKRDGGDPEVAVAAMDNLVRQGGASEVERQAIIKEVTPFVGHDDSRVRLNGFQVIAKWGAQDPDAVQTLAQGANDPDPQVRTWVLSAFGNGEFSYDSVRQPLLDTLHNPDEEPAIKAVAQRALARFALDEQAQAAIQQYMASESYQPPQTNLGFN
ncbi:HEAT repeat domain-containing protein [Methylomonas sp. EFPC3]|uniref:HEAT repeat domain-containing protein n=1 Tax=Methylomonas sp. EFPC3 TaxID=3021710 RepID=UPI002418005E|nr:HEAT repeat domain-containing protein [Methylomonas sp. EFPC3]WFP48569.1 HEAT repeat domain-containing protein [Methylomonas sp. EFPC3]